MTARSTPATQLQRYGPWAFLTACLAVAGVQQWMLWDWFIEDSAISFSYARNWVAGHGLVPWPGGERIEGYSNPLWVLLVAIGEVFGFSGFDSAKPMALGLTGLSLYLSWRLAHVALPERDRNGWALLPPALLATHSAFNCWAASGLENALFASLLLWAMCRQLEEVRDGSAVWSPVLWLGLALTRPEGLLYAAAAGAWFAVATWRAGRGWRPVLRWFLLFWIPGAALIAARLAYFAWPLPMTYYAKVGSGGYQLWNWNSRGWAQIREYGWKLWELGWVPLYLTGVFGLPFRGWIGVLLWTAGLAAALYMQLPALVVGLVLLAVGGAAGREGWQAKTLLWTMFSIALLFPAYANGDWMRGYRWMSLLAPSAVVLLTLGLREWTVLVAERVPTPLRGLVALALPGLFAGGLWAPKNWENTSWFVNEGHNESPFRIRRRVNYTAGLATRLRLDEPLVNLDMDMGAFLWWGDQWMVDIAGLVDVPVAVHTWADRAFVQEYLLEEHRPHLAHVHLHWEKTTELTAYTTFKRDWILMPPWKDGPGTHGGEYIRRDLLFHPEWTGTEGRRIDFEGASVLGWELQPVVSRGRAFALDVAVRTDKRLPGQTFQLFAFLSGRGRLQVWEVPLGDLVPMHQWRSDEVYVARATLELPDDVPLGLYDVGFAVMGPGGRFWIPTSGATEEPTFARGEVRWEQAVRVVKYREAPRRAEQRLTEAIGAADAGLCERAEALWREAWWTVPKDWGWRQTRQPVIGAALARCWVAEAAARPEREVDHLERARRWSHANRTLLDAAAPVADRLFAQGLAARETGDFETAYRRFDAVLRLQPWRAWARRYAEEARNERLGLGPLPIRGRSTRAEKTEPPP